MRRLKLKQIINECIAEIYKSKKLNEIFDTKPSHKWSVDDGQPKASFNTKSGNTVHVYFNTDNDNEQSSDRTHPYISVRTEKDPHPNDKFETLSKITHAVKDYSKIHNTESIGYSLRKDKAKLWDKLMDKYGERAGYTLPQSHRGEDFDDLDNRDYYPLYKNYKKPEYEENEEEDDDN
jgi:hypothetical protein